MNHYSLIGMYVMLLTRTCNIPLIIHLFAGELSDERRGRAGMRLSLFGMMKIMKDLTTCGSA